MTTPGCPLSLSTGHSLLGAHGRSLVCTPHPDHAHTAPPARGAWHGAGSTGAAQVVFAVMPQTWVLMPVWTGSTWGIIAIHLLVRHRHDGVLEFLTKVHDGLVDQEDGDGHEQQVDENKQDREDVLQAGLAEADAAGGGLAV